MEKKTFQKQTFLQGAAVLALATAIVKIIGAIYKIPLQNFIGTAGYSYFGKAYTIYDVLLMISTTGLPVAMSRMISEAQTLEQHDLLHGPQGIPCFGHPRHRRHAAVCKEAVRSGRHP